MSRWVLLAATGASLYAQQGVVGSIGPAPTAPDVTASLERTVTEHPEDLEARRQLLAVLREGQAKLPHARYVIERYPRSPLAGSSLLLLPPGPAYDELRDLWVRTVSQYPGDDAVLRHAVAFLSERDKPLAATLLRSRVDRSRAAATLLGFVIGRALIEGGAGLATGDLNLALENNPDVLMGAATALPNLAGKLPGGQDGQPWFQQGSELGRRARGLQAPEQQREYPLAMRLWAQMSDEWHANASTQYPQPLAARSMPVSTPTRLRVGSPVVQANLLKQVAPVFPDEARALRLSGRVTLNVVIGRDGRVLEAEVTEGHPVLRQAALDAVKQWEWRPTLLNGNPVEVATTVEVSFTLP